MRLWAIQPGDGKQGPPCRPRPRAHIWRAWPISRAAKTTAALLPTRVPGSARARAPARPPPTPPPGPRATSRGRQ